MMATGGGGCGEGDVTIWCISTRFRALGMPIHVQIEIQTSRSAFTPFAPSRIIRPSLITAPWRTLTVFLGTTRRQGESGTCSSVYCMPSTHPLASLNPRTDTKGLCMVLLRYTTGHFDIGNKFKRYS